MAIGNLNYTSSQIDTLLQKGAGLVAPDVSNLVLKTTASSDYITSSSMSSTYQANGNYVTQSTFSNDPALTNSQWNTYYNSWSNLLSSFITRVKNLVYPVGSVYLNWSSGSSYPSWGSWTNIGNSYHGLLGTYSTWNYTSTYGSDEKSMGTSNTAYSLTGTLSSGSCNHYHDSQASGTTHSGFAMSPSVVTITMDQGSYTGGTSSSSYSVWVSTSSGSMRCSQQNTAAASTSSHSHTVYSSATTPSKTVSVSQPRDIIYAFVRTA